MTAPRRDLALALLAAAAIAAIYLLVLASRPGADRGGVPAPAGSAPGPAAKAGAPGADTPPAEGARQPASAAPTVPAVPATPAPPASRPPRPRPTATPAGAQPAHVALSGYATWLVAPVGTAAAGPALRRALGPHWRGRAVTVAAAGGRRVVVVLTDWCLCRDRAGRPTLVDLSRGDFAVLAHLGAGVIAVAISWPR